jgi:hypothetical protein
MMKAAIRVDPRRPDRVARRDAAGGDDVVSLTHPDRFAEGSRIRVSTATGYDACNRSSPGCEIIDIVRAIQAIQQARSTAPLDSATRQAAPRPAG